MVYMTEKTWCTLRSRQVVMRNKDMVHDWEKTRCCGGGVARYGEDTLLLRKHTVTENTCCTLRRKRDVMERHVVKETEAIDP